MERQTKRIRIGSWEGLAYLVDDAWYVNPQSIAESMGFDWVKTRKKLVALYPDSIQLVQRGGGMGKQKPVIMRLDAAVRWLAGFAGNNHMAADRRVVAKQMAAQIAHQFAALAVSNGVEQPSREVVLMGGRHD